MAASDPTASAFTVRIGDYDVDIRNELGQGAWGTVYKGQHKDRKTEVAAKKLCLDPNVPEARELVRNESELLLKVKNHPYLLKIHHAQFIDQPNLKFHEFWIITSFCKEGNVSEYCMKHILSLKEKLRICRQTAAGLAFLHNLKPCIIHRDLKPENIFLDIVDGDLTAKLGDFGLARNMEHTFLTTIGGTQSYLAPEIWPWSQGRRVQFDEKIDTFALGLVHGLVLRQKTKGSLHDPENSMPLGQQMVIADETNKPLPVAIVIEKTDDEMTVKWKGLILQMTAYDPSQRPSMEHVEEVYAAMQGLDRDAPQSSTSKQSSGTTSTASGSKSRKARSDKAPAQRGRASANALHSNNDISMPAQFKKLSSVKLKSQHHVYSIGVNENYVLEFDENDGRLKKWDLSKGQVVFSVPLPDGVSAGCRKFLGPQGEVALWQRKQNDGLENPNNTYILDGKGRFLHQFPANDEPIAVISNNIVYVDEKGNLVVRSLSDHSQVLTLKIAGRGISICEEPTTGKLAITVLGNSTLLIFSPSGECLVQKKRTYRSCLHQAVACVSERLFAVVEQPNIVHLYEWSSGDELQEVTRHELGLGKLDFIYQMWMGPDKVFYMIINTDEIRQYQL